MKRSPQEWAALQSAPRTRSELPAGGFSLKVEGSNGAKNLRSIRGQQEIRLRVNSGPVVLELQAYDDGRGPRFEVATIEQGRRTAWRAPGRVGADLTSAGQATESDEGRRRNSSAARGRGA